MALIVIIFLFVFYMLIIHLFPSDPDWWGGREEGRGKGHHEPVTQISKCLGGLALR